jgi:hypothetical protein
MRASAMENIVSKRCLYADCKVVPARRRPCVTYKLPGARTAGRHGRYPKQTMSQVRPVFGLPDRLTVSHTNSQVWKIQGKLDNRKLGWPCQLIYKIMHTSRNTLVSYYRVFPVSETRNMHLRAARSDLSLVYPQAQGINSGLRLTYRENPIIRNYRRPASSYVK